MNLLSQNKDYVSWLNEWKSKIQATQIKTALAVNEALVRLYWDLGRSIVEKQEHSEWGSAFIIQMAKDLKEAFPETKGFSQSNLYSARRFFIFYKSLDQQPEFLQQLVVKIPWGHNVLIINKSKDVNEALFYVRETIQNNWSRNILDLQMDSDLYSRQGKAITNFTETLPLPQADLANETLKDPYIFGFLTLERNVQELELERKLVENITKFLMELGKGFAYMGRQYPLQVGKKGYLLDLLFYHVKLHCYVVIELKVGEFEPEYIGKLNFYLSAIDDQLRQTADNPTIGVLLCKTKDRLEVEYALRDINKPIGVSEFKFNELPLEIRRELPTVAELEAEILKDVGAEGDGNT